MITKIRASVALAVLATMSVCFAQAPEMNWAGHGASIKDGVIGSFNAIAPYLFALFAVFVVLGLVLKLAKKVVKA